MKNTYIDHEAACTATADQIDMLEDSVRQVQRDLHTTRKMARGMELTITSGLNVVAAKRKELHDLRLLYGLSV